MKPLSYLFIQIGAALCILLAVASFNFVVDPTSNYLAHILREGPVSSYVQVLESSPYGMKYASWGERAVKKKLLDIKSKNTEKPIDCAIVGSSRTMQISKLRADAQKWPDKCPDFVNLSISAGSIEDIITFMYLLLNKPYPARHIFIGIDPDTFAYGRNTQWEQLEGIHRQASAYFGLSKKQGGDSWEYELELAKNLVSWNYTKESYESWKKEGFSRLIASRHIYRAAREAQMEEFDFIKGHSDEAVTLPDGSHVYKSAYLKEKKDLTRTDFSELDPLLDKGTIQAIKAIIQKAHERGSNIYLILPPNPNTVWAQRNTPIVSAMEQIEEIVHTIGQAQGVRVLGSFRPEILGCADYEFIDSYHASHQCANRLLQNFDAPHKNHASSSE